MLKSLFSRQRGVYLSHEEAQIALRALDCVPSVVVLHETDKAFYSRTERAAKLATAIRRRMI